MDGACREALAESSAAPIYPWARTRIASSLSNDIMDLLINLSALVATLLYFPETTMIARTLSCLALSLAVLTPAVAQTAPTEPTPAPVKEKKVCRGDVGSTSRISRSRTCKTRAEWAAHDKAASGAPADASVRDLDRRN